MEKENGNSRIHIRLGSLELDFEGTESYIQNHLPELIEMLTSQVAFEAEEEESTTEYDLLTESSNNANKKLDMSTSTIANRLGSKSCKDLVLAACTHLHLVKGHEKYTRSNILAEMKTATSYYKQNFSKNLTPALQGLVKAGELNELADETYALEAKKLSELEKTLSA
jgi:hypothetical protein